MHSTVFQLMADGSILGDAAERFGLLEVQAHEEQLLGIDGTLPEHRKLLLGRVALMRLLGVRTWPALRRAIDAMGKYRPNDVESHVRYFEMRGLWLRYAPKRLRWLGADDIARSNARIVAELLAPPPVRHDESPPPVRETDDMPAPIAARLRRRGMWERRVWHGEPGIGDVW